MSTQTTADIVRAAALEHADEMGCAAFAIQMPNTTPPLFVFFGDGPSCASLLRMKGFIAEPTAANDAAQAVLQAHAAEVERLRADAARYQAVRNAGGLLKIYRYDDPADFCSGDWRYKPSPEEVDAWCDAAIDQAIARGKT